MDGLLLASLRHVYSAQSLRIFHCVDGCQWTAATPVYVLFSINDLEFPQSISSFIPHSKLPIAACASFLSDRTIGINKTSSMYLWFPLLRSDRKERLTKHWKIIHKKYATIVVTIASVAT